MVVVELCCRGPGAGSPTAPVVDFNQGIADAALPSAYGLAFSPSMRGSGVRRDLTAVAEAMTETNFS